MLYFTSVDEIVTGAEPFVHKAGHAYSSKHWKGTTLRVNDCFTHGLSFINWIC